MQVCETCKDIQKSFRIRHPHELKSAIEDVRKFINDGILVEISNGDSTFPCSPFSVLATEGPWDDYLQYIFKCVDCGRLFRLSAETYHGVGGEWELI
jgi:hypothetical protein